VSNSLYAESDLVKSDLEEDDSAEIELATSDMPNFAFGLGYGLLDEKSLMNIDFKVNIPINSYLSTQLLLNSNYLITGSSKTSFAQSEFSSNWFIRNEYGRLGIGLGVSEQEPMDETLDKERDVIGQFLGEAFIGPVSLTTNYISSDTTLSNVTSSRIGISYYFNEDLRTSLFREKYNVDEVGWRLDTYFQPKKFRRMGSVGIIARTGEDYDYLGAVVLYYFDYAVSLKQREREFH
jgi:hypothetical protein